ncbi:MAG: MFS transporter [Alphaproteobacteria bacterium]|nr:MFS transporter [Alphaproteobacteria bacterium]
MKPLPTTGAEKTRKEAQDRTAIALICAAHFVSHFYILLLPPVFAPVREEMAVSYTALGLALTAFNLVSALMQTPTGFLVDRIGARPVLVAGLLLGAFAIMLVAALPSYWMLVAAFALLGLANTVYHPADYAILASTVSEARIGKAFSVHTFAGYIGMGVAPATILSIAAVWGWRGAWWAAAGLGFAVALALIFFGQVLTARRRIAAPLQTGARAPDGWRLLFSAPILRNLFFFVLLAMSNGGIQNFSVVALGSVHGTAPAIANAGLSSFLILSAFGVLVGGVIADRTRRHERVAAICFVATSGMAFMIGWLDLGATLLVLLMAWGGLMNGIIQPSRDMMVRAVTPPGSFGKVFGFVSTGFNIGGSVSPLLYGWCMDLGRPGLVFAFVGGFFLLSLLTVITRRP